MEINNIDVKKPWIKLGLISKWKARSTLTFDINRLRGSFLNNWWRRRVRRIGIVVRVERSRTLLRNSETSSDKSIFSFNNLFMNFIPTARLHSVKSGKAKCWSVYITYRNTLNRDCRYTWDWMNEITHFVGQRGIILFCKKKKKKRFFVLTHICFLQKLKSFNSRFHPCIFLQQDIYAKYTSNPMIVLNQIKWQSDDILFWSVTTYNYIWNRTLHPNHLFGFWFWA